MSLTKNPKPKKIFFTVDKKTCRIFWKFKQLSNAIGGGVMLFIRQLKTVGFRPSLKYEYIVPRQLMC